MKIYDSIGTFDDIKKEFNLPLKLKIQNLINLYRKH